MKKGAETVGMCMWHMYWPAPTSTSKIQNGAINGISKKCKVNKNNEGWRENENYKLWFEKLEMKHEQLQIGMNDNTTIYKIDPFPLKTNICYENIHRSATNHTIMFTNLPTRKLRRQIHKTWGSCEFGIRHHFYLSFSPQYQPKLKNVSLSYT